MTNKERIIEIFYNKVKGRIPDVTNSNQRHDGRRGHWLEQQFGITPNASNEADLYGYELKNETSSKTTFGDWSANRYIFQNPDFEHIFIGRTTFERRNRFLALFGKPNLLKDNRLSWSGEPCPKISGYNSFGQILAVSDNNDIYALYSFSQDMRANKHELIPIELQEDNLVLALWFGEDSPTRRPSDRCLKEKLEAKFNDLGWFTCKTDQYGRYNRICFGEPMTFENWIELVKEGIVFFDSGMYETNPRPYSQWRAANRYWESLITEVYE